MERKHDILPKTDYKSPFYSSVPLQSHPTEVLSKRFESWRQIIKSLINYLKSVSIAQQQFNKINENLIETINFPIFNDIHLRSQKLLPAINQQESKNFMEFGSGSIQDIQIMLKKYHYNLAKAQYNTALELSNNVIPRLEELRKDLALKIKEIKNLNSDFNNSISEQIALTGQLLHEYIDQVEALVGGDKTVGGKADPYLLRLRLEIQLKKQLNEENLIEEAFINLQITGLELEKIIFQELQNSLKDYSELIAQEILLHYANLINELAQGILKKPNFIEWDSFIDKNHKSLINLKHNDQIPVPRNLNSIEYPYNKSIVSKCLRSGYFYKKNKFLKNYSKSFFILTINYLHEFKSSNLIQDSQPIHSISLNDSILTESNQEKFQLHTHSSNYIFKKPSDLSPQDFTKWLVDLKNLTSFNNFKERYEFINTKINLSRSSTPMLEISNPMDTTSLNDRIRKLSIVEPAQTEREEINTNLFQNANNSSSIGSSKVDLNSSLYNKDKIDLSKVVEEISK